MKSIENYIVENYGKRTADITTGFFGKDLVVQEFIYNSFVIVTLGSFGIDGLQKFAGKKEE
jgi:hypothetical protein